MHNLELAQNLLPHRRLRVDEDDLGHTYEASEKVGRKVAWRRQAAARNTGVW